MSSPDTGHVARRRAAVPHTSMFLRMLVRAAVLRRGRAASALLAMVVAAAVATAMLNLYVDVQAKLRREFRNYGANVVRSRQGRAEPACRYFGDSPLGPGQRRHRSSLCVRRRPHRRWPFGGRCRNGFRTGAEAEWQLVVGNRMAESFPRCPGWHSCRQRCRSHRESRSISAFRAAAIRLNPAGTLQTGAAEDSRIYISLADFTEWTHVPYSTIEISASGSAEEVSAVIQRLGQALPGGRRPPCAPGHGGRGQCIGQDALHASGGFHSDHSHRRGMRALHLDGMGLRPPPRLCPHEGPGRFGRMLQGFFAAEAAALGAVGATLGFAIGVGVAIWIGRANFHAPVTPRLSVLPVVLVGGIAIALVAAILPISLLRRVQPATILRGE